MATPTTSSLPPPVITPANPILENRQYRSVYDEWLDETGGTEGQSPYLRIPKSLAASPAENLGPMTTTWDESLACTTTWTTGRGSEVKRITGLCHERFNYYSPAICPMGWLPAFPPFPEASETPGVTSTLCCPSSYHPATLAGDDCYGRVNCVFTRIALTTGTEPPVVTAIIIETPIQVRWHESDLPQLETDPLANHPPTWPKFAFDPRFADSWPSQSMSTPLPMPMPEMAIARREQPSSSYTTPAPSAVATEYALPPPRDSQVVSLVLCFIPVILALVVSTIGFVCMAVRKRAARKRSKRRGNVHYPPYVPLILTWPSLLLLASVLITSIGLIQIATEVLSRDDRGVPELVTGIRMRIRARQAANSSHGNTSPLVLDPTDPSFQGYRFIKLNPELGIVPYVPDFFWDNNPGNLMVLGCDGRTLLSPLSYTKVGYTNPNPVHDGGYLLGNNNKWFVLTPRGEVIKVDMERRDRTRVGQTDLARPAGVLGVETNPDQKPPDASIGGSIDGDPADGDAGPLEEDPQHLRPDAAAANDGEEKKDEEKEIIGPGQTILDRERLATAEELLKEFREAAGPFLVPPIYSGDHQYFAPVFGPEGGGVRDVFFDVGSPQEVIGVGVGVGVGDESDRVAALAGLGSLGGLGTLGAIPGRAAVPGSGAGFGSVKAFGVESFAGNADDDAPRDPGSRVPGSKPPVVPLGVLPPPGDSASDQEIEVSPDRIFDERPGFGRSASGQPASDGLASDGSTSDGPAPQGPAPDGPTTDEQSSGGGTYSNGIPTLFVLTEADYFFAFFAPNLLTIIFTIPWRIIHHQIVSMEPFFHMATSQGITISHASRLRYRLLSGFVPPSSSLWNRDWAIAWAAILEYICAILAPIAAEAVGMGVSGECDESDANGCMVVMEVLPQLTRIAQVLLGTMLAATLALGYTMIGRTSGLRNDPRTVIGVTALLRDEETRRILHNVSEEDVVTIKAFKKKFGGEKLRLDDFLPRNGMSEYGITLMNSSSPSVGGGVSGEEAPARGEGEQARPGGIASSDDDQVEDVTPKPLDVRWSCAVLIAFAAFHIGLTIMILYWHIAEPEDSPFGEFMWSQRFGVRFLFAAVGVATNFGWMVVFDDALIFIPLWNLAKGYCKAEDTILRLYSADPYPEFLRSLLARRPFTAFLSFVSILSDFLPLLLTNVPYARLLTKKANQASVILSAAILAIMAATLLALAFFLWKYRPRFFIPLELLRKTPLLGIMVLACNSASTTAAAGGLSVMTSGEQWESVRKAGAYYKLVGRTGGRCGAGIEMIEGRAVGDEKRQGRK